jgi:hypothetical protein
MKTWLLVLSLVLVSSSVLASEPVHFRKEFCGRNEALRKQARSGVSQLCFGYAIYEDMAFRAVQLQYNLNNGVDPFQELLIDKGWERLPDGRIKLRVFLFGPIGENRETDAFLSFNQNGNVIQVSGRSILGYPYRLTRSK